MRTHSSFGQIPVNLHPYTKVSWVNPVTQKTEAQIFDRFESDAIEELLGSLVLAKIEYECDVLEKH